MTLKRPNMTAVFRTVLMPTLVLTWVSDLAQAGNEPREATQSIDLRLPRDASTGAWVQPLSVDDTNLPDIRRRPDSAGDILRGGGLRGDLPYGAGYEARQRGNGPGQGRGGGHGRGR